MPSCNHNCGRRPLAETLSAIAGVLNFILIVIMTFEAVVRLGAFLKDWKPAAKRKKMGFSKEGQK
jgi:hypothetical protein